MGTVAVRRGEGKGRRRVKGFGLGDIDESFFSFELCCFWLTAVARCPSTDFFLPPLISGCISEGKELITSARQYVTLAYSVQYIYQSPLCVIRACACTTLVDTVYSIVVYELRSQDLQESLNAFLLVSRLDVFFDWVKIRSNLTGKVAFQPHESLRGPPSWVSTWRNILLISHTSPFERVNHFSLLAVAIKSPFFSFVFFLFLLHCPWAPAEQCQWLLLAPTDGHPFQPGLTQKVCQQLRRSQLKAAKGNSWRAVAPLVVVRDWVM